ncbi:YuzF family protein [Bacillus sp. V3B]|uniref:YuzF family protein n=1 Tax=Bacillus sp. V3B TaxID=2804915 RepID=UPI00210DD7EA|nr:YuzF family protein [Bacillus sp. V3B]MCQ6274752.1 YuzF family protein [Bacillus sp. V3B]
MNHLYTYRANPQMTQNGPMQVVVVEPFVYEALRSLIGKRAVLDTTRGSVSGTVVDAKVDHVVIQEHDSIFFVRISEIVWIMPES